MFKSMKTHFSLQIFCICLLLLGSYPKLMYISPSNDVTSCDIDTAVATQILLNSVYISSYK